jgi:putative photosynthetic complex assembly protein 2
VLNLEWLNDTRIAVAFAIVVWWASTGLVLLLDGLPRGSFRWSLLISSVLAAAALLALSHTAQQTTVAGAYCAFTCALLVWGWHELSFLTGWITGPRRVASPPGLTGWMRFSQAAQAVLWHEVGLVMVFAAIAALTWDAPNQTGTWTFAVLWLMRLSAKLNLYFGVRNLSEEFLPIHLRYLQSFFRRRRMNWFFPFPVAAASALTIWIFHWSADPTTPEGPAMGAALVGTLLALAVIEHWMLVLPINPSTLWRWALREGHRAPTPAPVAPVSSRSQP